jgi:hypothetical protein
LEEYFFKPSAIVSYSAGRLWQSLCCSTSATNICRTWSPFNILFFFAISRVKEAFDETGKSVQEQYNKRITRFLDEFEYYIEAFKNQRRKGIPY